MLASDKQKGYQSQETVDKYRTHTSGFLYYGSERRVLTTRSDGYMRFDVSPVTVSFGVG